MVEGEHQLATISAMSGRPERVGVRRAEGLDGPNEVVAEEADGAAVERGQVRRTAPTAGARRRDRAASPYGSPSSPSAQRSGAVRHEAEEGVAAQAALLGRLQEERRPVEGLAKLEERRDGRLGVVDEALDDRERCSRGSAAALIEHLQDVRQRDVARAKEDGEVVEDVGGLFGDALVRFARAPRA